MESATVIHWFRRDLRLRDNLALSAAQKSGYPVLPVFVLEPSLYSSVRASIPRLAFLLEALRSLDQSLRKLGSRLYVIRGDARNVLPVLVQLQDAVGLYLNRDYSPFALKRDIEVEAAVNSPVYRFDDALLVFPGGILTESGSPYSVFTPFKKKWLQVKKQSVESLPGNTNWAVLPDSVYGVLDVLPVVPSVEDLFGVETISLPIASEIEAQNRLENFLAGRVYKYAEGRNLLAASSLDDTYGSSSFLSPYLRFGMLSPRQVYWGARRAYASLGDGTVNRAPSQEGVESWVSELIWREFYMHILFHFPHVLKSSFRPKYDRLVWRHIPDELEAWKSGMTGYPVVDAAMRQLRAMGWIPNRARMIVASFLTKDLLISWQEGERYFMDCLIDGDPAANNGGWQWSAGTGTDAQPYFRIFNPIQQSKNFDPEGIYIRRWVPELRDIPLKHIHSPWEWSRGLKKYPQPMVDHGFARERALSAYKAVD